MIVYLGGAIQGLSFEEAASWRKIAREILEFKNIIVLDPMRHRLWNDPDEQYKFDPNELIHRDLTDVQKSDVILAGMADLAKPDINCVGTITEMATARSRKPWIPIIVFIGDMDKDKISIWLKYYLATKVTSSVEEACKYICTVLSD